MGRWCHNSAYTDLDDTVGKFEHVLCEIQSELTAEEHRWGYNSIKHGLRATHGRFALALGIEETPGVEAPPEAMQVIGYSHDASFFDIAKPLTNATKEASKINFCLESVTTTWSLEKVLCELQTLSLLLNNAVSALRIAAGAPPSTVTFSRLAESDTWWTYYFSLHGGAVPKASMNIHFDVRDMKLPEAEDVFASCRRKGSHHQGC